MLRNQVLETKFNVVSVKVLSWIFEINQLWIASQIWIKRHDQSTMSAVGYGVHLSLSL
jgi:hypothetical protein